MNILYLRTIFFLFIVFFSLLYTVKAQEFFTSSQDTVTLTVPSDITLEKVSVDYGAGFKTGDTVKAGDLLAIFVDKDHNKITVSSEITGKITYINETFYRIYRSIPAGTTLLKIEKQDIVVQSTEINLYQGFQKYWLGRRCGRNAHYKCWIIPHISRYLQTVSG